MAWRIYYANGSVVEGSSKGDWQKAPASGVQVVVDLNPPPKPFPVQDRLTSGLVGCNRLKPNATFWTGVDTYDPFGYGREKTGTLLSDADYFAIWERAYADN